MKSTMPAMARLLDIMARLRDPKKGCPWDLEQDFASIVPYTLEEAHEVAEAIEHDDMKALREELGDLLFQVVFYARLAEEQDLFDFGDVVEAVNEKMIRRHPHVFGKRAGKMSHEEIREQWENIKDQEKAAKAVEAGTRPDDGGEQMESKPAQAGPASLLDGVPRSLPALSCSVKLQGKAARAGFDWPSLSPVFDKMREELEELEEEIGRRNDDGGKNANRAAIEDEYGDVLFVMSNVGRHLGIDPEQALRRANDKFTRRFQTIERLLAKRGKTPFDSNLEEMEELWQIAKQNEKRKLA